MASISEKEDLMTLTKTLINPVASHVEITQELLGGVAYLVSFPVLPNGIFPWMLAGCNASVRDIALLMSPTAFSHDERDRSLSPNAGQGVQGQ